VEGLDVEPTPKIYLLQIGHSILYNIRIVSPYEFVKIKIRGIGGYKVSADKWHTGW